MNSTDWRREIMAAKANPRSIGVEGPFIPSTPMGTRRMAKLLVALEDEGYGWRIVAGIRGWLEAKATGRPDPTSAPTRSKYRRIIKGLELDPGPFPRRRESGVELVQAALVEVTGAAQKRARAQAREAIRALAPIMYLPSGSPETAPTAPLSDVA
jgi:hypothetical protein